MTNKISTALTKPAITELPDINTVFKVEDTKASEQRVSKACLQQ
jgi:hypothetical protein